MRKLTAAVLAVMVLFLLCSCSSEGAVTGPDGLEGKNVGAEEGSAAEFALVNQTHTAMTVFTYLTAEDAALAVISGEVDCAVADADTAKEIVKGSKKLKVLGEKYLEEGYSFIAAIENSDLTEDINAALGALSAGGTLDEIAERWRSGADTGSVETAAENDFSLILAVSADNRPYSYYDENGELCGIDIDTARAVCDSIGIGLTVIEADKDELTGLVRSGKAHIAAGCFMENEKDAGLVSFSDVYYTSQQVIIVKK